MLLRITASQIKEMGSSDCTDTVKGEGGFNSLTKQAKGSIFYSENCKKAWARSYARVPENWMIRVTDCYGENYSCDTEQDWFTRARTSRGSLTVKCTVTLELLDAYGNPMQRKW